MSRRGPIPQPAHLRTADLSLDPGTREVRRGARTLSLTRTEFAILELLMRHAGRVLPRERVIESVWGHGADIESNTLDAFMRLLRSKIELPGESKLLQTVRGVGYALRRRNVRTWSIGQRLTLWYAAVLLAGLALFGAGIWLLLENRLMAAVDESLAQEIAGLQTVFQIEGPESDAKQMQVELAEFTREIPDGGLIQLRDSSGAVLLPLDGQRLFESAAVAGYRTVLRKGRTLRLFTGDIHYEGQTYTATAGASLERVQSIVRDFRNLLFAIAPGVLLIACLGGYWLSRRALRPVDEITHAARSISVTSLSKRLPVPRTGDEIQRLSEAWNDLLIRLEKAVGRIHQFTADASHELRTPVALIRSTAELMLRRERTPDEYRRALEDIEREAERMTGLTQSLLELAREDAGGRRSPCGPSISNGGAAGGGTERTAR